MQAALSGYSDLPMRLVARARGAPYALHEVVLDEHVLQKGRLRDRILAVPAADHPVGGQLMGAGPATSALAARALVAAGYDVVDLNFGCPVAKVLGRCRGGWLLQEPATALAMVDAVLQAVGGDVPVTVKMRRGYDDRPASERAFFAILEGAFARGVAAVTLHPRTVRQKYVGPSRWDFLARARRHVGQCTLLGSGDVFSAFDVVRMLAETGVDGVSVARGCIGNPFVFAQVRTLLAGGTPMSPTCAELGDALREHASLAREHLGERGLSAVRTHAIKYAQFHRRPVEARQAVVAVKSWAQLDAAVDAWFCAAHDTGPPEPLRPGHAVVPTGAQAAGAQAAGVAEAPGAASVGAGVAGAGMAGAAARGS